MARNISVMGIYSDRTTASDATNVLLKAGYRATDISVLSSNNRGSKDLALEARTKALEGAAAGAALGAILGAALAWFASVQTVTIPGVGLDVLVTAGPVLAAIAGAGAGGALGWIVGLLAGMSMTEYAAKRYAGRIRRGGILLSVHCDSPEWCERAKKLLKSSGALHISAASESAADFGTADKPTERAPVVPAERAPVVFAESPEVPAPETSEYIAPETRK